MFHDSPDNFFSPTKGLTQALRKLGELIDMFTSVTAAWDAKPKVEVKTLEQVITKVVPLDHAEVVQGPVPNCEFDPDRMRKEKEKHRFL